MSEEYRTIYVWHSKFDDGVERCPVISLPVRIFDEWKKYAQHEYVLDILSDYYKHYCTDARFANSKEAALYYEQEMGTHTCSNFLGQTIGPDNINSAKYFYHKLYDKPKDSETSTQQR